MPGSAGAVNSGPSRPWCVPSWCGPYDVHFQIAASATMTVTTTRLITVSSNIAHGKNGLPRSLTSFL